MTTTSKIKKTTESPNVKKEYEWHEKTICSYYCEKETGLIVAQYSRVNFSDGVYHAQVNGDNLGQYITEKQARQAIEKLIAENDKTADEMKIRFKHLMEGRPND